MTDLVIKDVVAGTVRGIKKLHLHNFSGDRTKMGRCNRIGVFAFKLCSRFLRCMKQICLHFITCKNIKPKVGDELQN